MNLGVYLKTPNQTRWNCWFDSSKFLLLHFKNSPKLCDAFKLNRFSKNDLEFLEEYVVVMEPLCICLNVLQGGKICILGFCCLPLQYSYKNMMISLKKFNLL